MLGFLGELQQAQEPSQHPPSHVQGNFAFFSLITLLQEFFGNTAKVPLNHRLCVAWTWRLCVCSREHLLTRPFIGTPPAPPTVSQIQCFEEIYQIFQKCFTLVRNTHVPRHLQETLAQLRCALLELSHLVMCSLAYGKLFDITQSSKNISGVTLCSDKWCHAIPVSDLGFRIDLVYAHVQTQCRSNAANISSLLTILAGESSEGNLFPISIKLG